MQQPIALAAAFFAVGGMAQWSYTDCSQLLGGSGYVCSPDYSTVSYCQPGLDPEVVDSQYCDYGDCWADQFNGFCTYEISKKNQARGPTDCTQVNPEGGYVCSEDYTTLYQCSGSVKAVADICDDPTCFASTTGDQGMCIR
ncbi:hypothetical protein SMMN14_05322 [Sphaerulina musiva]